MVLSLRSSIYILAIMNHLINITMKSNLTSLSIDISLFEMSKMRAV